MPIYRVGKCLQKSCEPSDSITRQRSHTALITILDRIRRVSKMHLFVSSSAVSVSCENKVANIRRT